MDAAAIIALINQVIKVAVDQGPTIIQVAEDATDFSKIVYNNLIKGQPVTQAQLDALGVDLAALSDDLQTPLPPDDGTTTT